MLARKFGRLVVLGEFQNRFLHTLIESRPPFKQSSQSNVINLIQNPARVGMRVALNREPRFLRRILTVFGPYWGH